MELGTRLLDQPTGMEAPVRCSKTYPHLVIDDFLPRSLAEEILSSFPADTDPVWDQHGSRFIVEGGIAQNVS